jgi:carbamoyl-phosphate synthase large subunit
LAKAKSIFEDFGIFVLVSDEWLVQMANDKYKTFLFLKEFGFPSIPTFTDLTSFYENYGYLPIPFPLIIKPRWGMGSLSVYEVEDEEELRFFVKKARKEVLSSFLKFESSQAPEQEILIMPKIQGDEYMLDIINDLEGNHIVTVVNKKLLRKGGETEAVETVSHPMLEALGEKIASVSKHPLVMDVDVIMSDDTPYILEFNPRFSGGYPFSHCAGVNLPKALIRWLKALPIDPSDCLVPKIGTTSMKGLMMVVNNP